MTQKIDPTIAAFFKDPDASSVVIHKASQIVAPIVQGEAIKPEELMMGGGLRVIQFIIDRSPSMETVAEMLRNDFVQEFVPALLEAREDDISVLRVGGISFSSDITPIWEKQGPNGPVYYHGLTELPPITKAEYDPDTGYGTALHAAMLDGVPRGLKYCSITQAATGSAPDLDVIVLSDGANNENPRNPSDVRQMIESADKRRVRFVFFYFETGLGLKDPKVYAVNELGFDPENVVAFGMNPGETKRERQKRFRRMLRVMSRVSASKGTSAVNAQAAQAAAAASSDDDIV